MSHRRCSPCIIIQSPRSIRILLHIDIIWRGHIFWNYGIGRLSARQMHNAGLQIHIQYCPTYTTIVLTSIPVRHTTIAKVVQVYISSISFISYRRCSRFCCTIRDRDCRGRRDGMYGVTR